MMNKKSKKSDEKENINVSPTPRHSFTPFTNLRKSFKRLKQRNRGQSMIVEKGNYKNVTAKKDENHDLIKKSSDSQNLLRRIASGRRFRRKNVQSMITPTDEIRRFNVVEWSSCESLSDNFEKKVQKHNSLRRSKASLLMPVNSHDQKKLSPPCTKITRYCSMNAINDDDEIKFNNKWYSSQQNVSLLINNNDMKLLKRNGEKNSHLLSEKRKRPKGRKNEHASLPNICEDKLKERTMDIEVDDFNRGQQYRNKSVDYSSSRSIENILGKKLQNKRLSLVLLDKDLHNSMYNSSPCLNRPPIPSAPKPTTRRDRALRRCVSTEAISPRKRKADYFLNKSHKRTLSDCTAQDRPSFSKDDLVDGCLNAKSIITKQISTPNENRLDVVLPQKSTVELSKNHGNKRQLSLCASVNDMPSFLLENENVWKHSMASYELPLAIAEAVWDHTSLNGDELTFASGDVIAVLFTEDDSWWWGARGNDEGWFPASYVRLRVVQEIDDDLAPQPHKERAQLVDNNANNNEEPVVIVPRKGSVLSVIGIQERAKNIEHAKTVRAKCVEELLNTEKDYVQMLKNIIEGYLNKVRQEKTLFTASDAEIIFSNIESLYKFHKTFVDELQDNIKMNKMEESVVGHVFLKHKSNFEIYSQYCNNQPRSSARISTLSKEKKYELFFETCRLRQNMIRLSLDGFLLSPVQRICKYPLQLKELLKHTSSDHADYKTLQEARMCMANVASLINERKRRLENVNKLARWQLTVANWKDENVVMRSSDLLMKGPLTKVTNGRRTERYCYLFDHQLIYFRKEANNKRQALTYRGRIDLDTCVIENLGDDHVSVADEAVHNTWRLWNENKKKWCYFAADTQEKKESWIKALEDEREYVKEEQAKGFVVLAEVRQAAIETATEKHLAGIKRGRMRRKSICTNHPELETTFGAPLVPPPLQRQMAVHGITVNTISNDVSAAVTKRSNKPRRNRSFRWSLNNSILEKYF